MQRKESPNRKKARKQTCLRIEKYKGKTVSEYVNQLFCILPPMSLRPNICSQNRCGKINRTLSVARRKNPHFGTMTRGPIFHLQPLMPSLMPRDQYRACGPIQPPDEASTSLWYAPLCVFVSAHPTSVYSTGRI